MKKAILAVIFLFCASSFADTVSIYMQNDAFLPIKSDRYYSHGTRIEYLNDDIGYSIGQYMYTPTIISKPEILYGDRPYCGWLYGSIFKEFPKERFSDYFELQLGMIGEYSYADKTQTFVHKVIGSRKPMGWGNQISSEPCLNLFWEERYPIKIVDEIFYVDPEIGAAIGNFYSGANIGIGSRIGYNVPKYEFQKSIQPSILSVKMPLKYIYAFVKINESYVAHNSSIEGGMFSDDSPYTAETEDFVFDFEAGINSKIYGFGVCFSAIKKGSEFKGQKMDESYGTITVSFDF